MKIGILTQRLFTNYGGLMQSLALQTVLENMGHNVMIFDREYNDIEMFSYWIRLKRRLRKLCRDSYNLLCKKEKLSLNKRYIANEKYIRQNTDAFIAKYHHSSPKIYTKTDLKHSIEEWHVDAIVVGSDQVWRPIYSPMISNYFLDFTEGWSIKRISYAASFGVDEWEYTKKDTHVCSLLAKKFDAISVRENSGIQLCKKYLGVDAIQTLDPTLLLDKDFYIDIVNKEKEPTINGGLFCYILDNDCSKKSIINALSRKMRLNAFYCMPKSLLQETNMTMQEEDCVYPRPTQWLRSFMDANMVITDSYHGLVFSLIFNKPFWIIVNKGRGEARFNSILNLFDLKSRIIDLKNWNHIDWKEPIDWSKINGKREKLKQYSISFLTQALS